ncbi:hypothetical protein [Microscilla marina]|uniref:Lipoprotein, putative n=1 Tax=Microscilla marina ATCC 23134 TaxID=313606 RepID=A1ZTG6_MICM2|nr:hypothetical protein [Microscilla marina]EAY26388.1 lipoprotein, putative [Microscilla marina ATCC 23134]
MRKAIYYVLFLGLINVLFSCKSAPEIEGFDAKKWKGDPNACKNYRAALLPALEKNKDKLVKVEAGQLMQLLGRPDKNELYRRNQRFYVYFIDAGSQCKGNNGSLGRTLRVRIDALQRVSEVVVN